MIHDCTGLFVKLQMVFHLSILCPPIFGHYRGFVTCAQNRVRLPDLDRPQHFLHQPSQMPVNDAGIETLLLICAERFRKFG